MKILLTCPVSGTGHSPPSKIIVPNLPLRIIAALTPPEHQIVISEETVEPIDFEQECDVVGISTATANAKRAYEIADEFRKRGKTIIMGGIHPTMLPDEALQHCDCVVIGEVEGVWKKLMADLEKGKLKKKYTDPFPLLDTYIPRLDIDNNKGRLGSGFAAVETTRGCPYTCNFCTVPVQFGRKLRHRPIEHVVKDIVLSGKKKVFFLDDNIIGNPKYAREMLKALIPLKIQWMGQSSMKVLQKNPDITKLAIQSGCIGLFFGLESVSDSMSIIPKAIKDKQENANFLKHIRDSGIHVHTAVIFGFDTDTEGVFDETLEFLLKNKISSAGFATLIPFPGTPLFDELDKEGRILTRDWDEYNDQWGSTVYQPKNFSPEKLYYETNRVKVEFTKFSNIYARAWANRRRPLIYLMINTAFYGIHKSAMQYWVKRNPGLTF
ncbi:MAG: radical SAM protein [Leptospirales bacterium]